MKKKMFCSNCGRVTSHKAYRKNIQYPILYHILSFLNISFSNLLINKYWVCESCDKKVDEKT